MCKYTVMEFKIKKTLGVGYAGTVYLSETDGEESVTKIEKYDGDMTTKSQFIRQIKFDELASMHPDCFMTLVFSGVMEDCKHKQPVPKIADKSLMKFLASKNKLTKCSVLSYTPVLDGTWDSISDRLTDKQYLDALNQLVRAIDIMRKNSYLHRDIHGQNIMYKRSGKKLRWYIIDYGTMQHPSFELASHEQGKEQLSDINYMANSLMVSKIWAWIRKKKIELPPSASVLAYIKADTRWNEIKTHLPKTKNQSDYFECVIGVTLCLYQELYMDAVGIKTKNRQNLMSQQRFSEIFLYMFKHSRDKSYSGIRKKIKSLM